MERTGSDYLHCSLLSFVQPCQVLRALRGHGGVFAVLAGGHVFPHKDVYYGCNEMFLDNIPRRPAGEQPARQHQLRRQLYSEGM